MKTKNFRTNKEILLFMFDVQMFMSMIQIYFIEISVIKPLERLLKAKELFNIKSSTETEILKKKGWKI